MKKVILFLNVISFFACTEAPTSTGNTNVQTDTIMPRTTGENVSTTDSLVIVVDSTGAIMMGNEVVKMENLKTELIDSLQMIEKKYGKMPDTIICRTKGDVLMGTRGAIKDVILEAQMEAKKE